MFELFNGDCLDVMKEIPDNSIDLILCDPPYGTTPCKWDAVIPLDLMWAEYKRIIKPCGVIALFSAQPFTARLVSSNFNMYRYSWYWKKFNKTGFANAKIQPMRCIEEVCVFYDNTSPYFDAPKTRAYLKDERVKTGLKTKAIGALLGSNMASHYFTNGIQFTVPSEKDYAKLQTTGCFSMSYEELRALYKSECDAEAASKPSVTYNPQGVRKVENGRVKVRNCNHEDSTVNETLKGGYVPEFTGYPNHVLEFDYDRNGERLHPTQKPVPLLEYPIKTHSNEGETVLDNCMGSGSTGVAAYNTNRRFIGIEKTKHYFECAQKRLTALGG